MEGIQHQNGAAGDGCDQGRKTAPGGPDLLLAAGNNQESQHEGEPEGDQLENPDINEFNKTSKNVSSSK